MGGGESGLVAAAGRKLESASFQRFQENAARGRSGFMEALQRVAGPP